MRYKYYWVIGLGIWCLTPLSITFHLYRGDQFLLVEETGVPGENKRPTTRYRQTSSHNIVSSTPRNERDSNLQR